MYRTNKACYFSLLEFMIGMAVLLMVSGSLSWNLYQWIEKKRFTSSIDRLGARIQACRLLSMSTQVDWEGRLVKQKKGWLFSTHAINGLSKLSPVVLYFKNISIEGKAQDLFTIQFFSGGKVAPIQSLVIESFDSKNRSVVLNLSALLGLQEEDKTQEIPLHPLLISAQKA